MMKYKMMRKGIPALLTLSMCMGTMSTTAFADENGADGPSQTTVSDGGSGDTGGGNDIGGGGDGGGTGSDGGTSSNGGDTGSEDGNNQQPSGNSQQPSGDSQQPSGDSQQPSSDSQQPSSDSQQPNNSIGGPVVASENDIAANNARVAAPQMKAAPVRPSKDETYKSDEQSDKNDVYVYINTKVDTVEADANITAPDGKDLEAVTNAKNEAEKAAEDAQKELDNVIKGLGEGYENALTKPPTAPKFEDSLEGNDQLKSLEPDQLGKLEEIAKANEQIKTFNAENADAITAKNAEIDAANAAIANATAERDSLQAQLTARQNSLPVPTTPEPNPEDYASPAAYNAAAEAYNAEVDAYNAARDALAAEYAGALSALNGQIAAAQQALETATTGLDTLQTEINALPDLEALKSGLGLDNLDADAMDALLQAYAAAVKDYNGKLDKYNANFGEESTYKKAVDAYNAALADKENAAKAYEAAKQEFEKQKAAYEQTYEEKGNEHNNTASKWNENILSKNTAEVKDTIKDTAGNVITVTLTDDDAKFLSEINGKISSSTAELTADEVTKYNDIVKAYNEQVRAYNTALQASVETRLGLAGMTPHIDNVGGGNWYSYAHIDIHKDNPRQSLFWNSATNITNQLGDKDNTPGKTLEGAVLNWEKEGGNWEQSYKANEEALERYMNRGYKLSDLTDALDGGTQKWAWHYYKGDEGEVDEDAEGFGNELKGGAYQVVLKGARQTFAQESWTENSFSWHLDIYYRAQEKKLAELSELAVKAQFDDVEPEIKMPIEGAEKTEGLDVVQAASGTNALSQVTPAGLTLNVNVPDPMDGVDMLPIPILPGGGTGTTTGDTVTVADTPTPLAETPEVEVPEVEVPEVEVPLAETPEEIEVPDEAVPLAATPEIEITDEAVPLADVPKTGDTSAAWSLSALASAAGLVLLSGLRRKERDAK